MMIIPPLTRMENTAARLRHGLTPSARAGCVCRTPTRVSKTACKTKILSGDKDLSLTTFYEFFENGHDGHGTARALAP